jgi:hypothetical protein
MKKIMKVVLGGIFAVGIMTFANAQTDSLQNVPQGEDIICLQVEDNVFECTLKNGVLEESEEDVLDPGVYDDEVPNPKEQDVLPNEEKEVPNFDEGNRDQDIDQEEYKNNSGVPLNENPSKEDDASEKDIDKPTGKDIKNEDGQSDGWSREDILDQSDTALTGEMPEIITI